VVPSGSTASPRAGSSDTLQSASVAVEHAGDVFLGLTAGNGLLVNCAVVLAAVLNP